MGKEIMKRFLGNHRPGAFLISATVIALIILAAFGSADRKTSFAERVGGDIVSPVQSGASGIVGWFGSVKSYFGNVGTLREENEKLKSENTNLQKQINDMQGLESENGEFRAMLDLKKTQTDLTLLAAETSAQEPSGWFSTYILNRGSHDGVERNQFVVTGNRELIGKITRVGDNWSEVTTIIDPESAVSGYIRRSKSVAVIEGNSSLRYDGLCKLGYVSRDADIQPGDYVETSGLGGIYPKGIVIGRITEVFDDNATMSRNAIVEPIADVRNLGGVFIVTSFKETDLSLPDPSANASKNTSKSIVDDDEDIVMDTDEDIDEYDDDDDE